MGKNDLEINKDWLEEKSLNELEKSLINSGWDITSKTEDKGNELIEAKRTNEEGVHEELSRSSKHVNDEKNNFKSHYYSMSYTKKQEFKKD